MQQFSKLVSFFVNFGEFSKITVIQNLFKPNAQLDRDFTFK